MNANNHGKVTEDSKFNEKKKAARVLIVDDEERYREILFKRLQLRGYQVKAVGDGEDAIRAVRRGRPDVVLLDLRMPGMQGEDILKEIKRIAPEVQVVILTGHGSVESATTTGRLDAYAYLQKPCEDEQLISTIELASREKVYAMARHEIPRVETQTLWGRLWGTQNSRPLVLLLGMAIFAAIVLAPPPQSLLNLLSKSKSGHKGDVVAGYSDYAKMKVGDTIAAQYSRANKRTRKIKAADGSVIEKPLEPYDVAQSAKVMLAILFIAAFFWATGALPMGVTAFLVGLLMYVFQVFPPDMVAKAYAKDSVIFIMGVLAMSVGIAKTGLDRRIALLLLGTSRSIAAFLFIFCPLLAVTASFISEHALVAFIAPILLIVYFSAKKSARIDKDPALVVLLLLALNFVGNQGGPGSPAAGGRNAVMIGILSDYGIAPTFGQWMKYGLPFVPVMALTIATYFFFVLRPKITIKDLNIASIVKKEADKLGKMTAKEMITAVVLFTVIVLWITQSDYLGMGGPVLFGIVALAAFRIMSWRDINRISWDVVALYAGATAMGAGLASTGAALWLAQSAVSFLPDFMSSGEGLAVAVSLIAGVVTNFMSDGATVSAIGPITVPMASVADTHPWMVGLATAFSSSFANCLVIGTPNNAIVYALARDPDTGEQLVSLGDFFRHGIIVTLLAFGVLWIWTIFGYWRLIGF